MRFFDKQKKTTKKVSVEFHILDKENDLNSILLGLNFLVPFVSEIWLNNHIIKVKLDKYNHVIPLVEENHKITFREKEAFSAGAGIV